MCCYSQISFSSIHLMYIRLINYCANHYSSELGMKFLADFFDSGRRRRRCTCGVGDRPGFAEGRQFDFGGLDFDFNFLGTFARLGVFAGRVSDTVRHDFRRFRVADVAGLSGVVGRIDQQRSDGESLFYKNNKILYNNYWPAFI